MAAAAALLLIGLFSGTARADEEESDEASMLAEQAISLIANDAGDGRVSERIEDALMAPKKEGVDLALVRQALDVVERPGRTEAADAQARKLLLNALGGKLPSAPKPGTFATGTETGTSTILGEFRPARGVSDNGDAVLLGLAGAATAGGLWLSHRLRPPHTIRQLEHDTAGGGSDDTAEGGAMTPPVSTSDRLSQFGLGQEVLCRAVSGGVVGFVVEPAAVDHADPCVGQDPGGVRVVHAAGSGPLVDVRRPGTLVAAVVREGRDGLAEAFVAGPAVGDPAHAAGRLGDRGDAGERGDGVRAVVGVAGIAPLGRFRRAVDAVDERMGIKALAYPVPEHANNLTWSLGGLTAVSFVILLVTGIYIAQFYSPMPENANQSVRDLVTDVWLGGFARGLHYWAAQTMFVMALLHLLRVFFHASFKKPREGNWIVGVAMFLLTFLAIFTGTVIKWDQEGYEALIHNLDVAELLGGAGVWFTSDLADRVPLLLRLYTAHAVIIPGLILLLFVWHALLVKRHRISPHPDIPAPERETPEPFTAHLMRVASFGLVLLGVLSALAVLVPPVIGPTPVEGIEVTRPLWMFWWFFPMEQWFGVASIAFVIVGVFGLLFLVPFLDRGPKRRWRERKVATAAAVVVLLALAAVTVNVWVNNPRGH